MTGKRFQVIELRDAQKYGWPEAEEFGQAGISHYRRLLYECDAEDKPVRLVGYDGGEPEDQTLSRDWEWVVVELNQLADEVCALRQNRDKEERHLMLALLEDIGAELAHQHLPCDDDHSACACPLCTTLRHVRDLRLQGRLPR